MPDSKNLLNKALLEACVNRKAEEVNTLLAKGADPNSKDDNGNTALACSKHHTGISAALIGYGAEIKGIKKKSMSGYLETYWNMIKTHQAGKNLEDFLFQEEIIKKINKFSDHYDSLLIKDYNHEGTDNNIEVFDDYSYPEGKKEQFQPIFQALWKIVESEEYLKLLQPLDEFIKQNSKPGHDYSSVPASWVQIGSHIWPAQPEEYQPIKNKGRLLQQGVNEVLCKYGIDILTKQTVFAGFVNPELANAKVSQEPFVENIAFGAAFMHGKYKHLLDIYVIGRAIEEGIITPPEGIEISELLTNILSMSVHTVKPGSASSDNIWNKMLDEGSTGLSSSLKAKLSFRTPEDATTCLMREDSGLPWLSGYLRNQFYNQINKIQAIHTEKHATAKIPQEVMLTVYAKKEGDFGNSNVKEYYISRGFTEDPAKPDFIYRGEVSIDLSEAEDGVVTKYYNDQLYRNSVEIAGDITAESTV